jgi:hypothetical protein
MPEPDDNIVREFSKTPCTQARKSPADECTLAKMIRGGEKKKAAKVERKRKRSCLGG